MKGIKKFYGKDAVDLLESFLKLSKEGKKRVCVYAKDMEKNYPDS